jgi:hypothetical protein
MGNTIRCRFQCIQADMGHAPENNNYFRFEPKADGSPENKEFWKWTPGGGLNFSCTNPNVKFEVGKDYYLDLTEAPSM